MARTATRVDEALEMVVALSRPEQHELYNRLQERLGEEFAEESADDREVRKRGEALAAMKLAAEKLGLAPGVAPTVAQYRELGLEPSATEIGRRFKRWRFARKAFADDGRLPVAGTATTRRQPRRRPRTNYKPSLVSLRSWLEDVPDGRRRPSYDAWAKSKNAALADGEPGHLASERIRDELNRSWADIVRIARGEVSLEDVPPKEEKVIEDWNEGPDDLVGRRVVAEILGKTTNQLEHLREKPGFPPPALVMGGNSLWLRSDIEAHAAGKKLRKKEPDWLRPRYYGLEDVSKRLGLSRSRVRAGGDPVPPPVAVLSGRSLWLAKDVERSRKNR